MFVIFLDTPFSTLFRGKDDTRKVIDICGDVIEEAGNLRFLLGSFVTRGEGLMRDVKYRIKSGWMK